MGISLAKVVESRWQAARRIKRKIYFYKCASPSSLAYQSTTKLLARTGRADVNVDDDECRRAQVNSRALLSTWPLEAAELSQIT